jgi:hypothetical protein
MSLKHRSPQSKSLHAPLQSKSEALRQKRLAHEEAQKVAGLWGDMSVGTIRRQDRIFVYLWKGDVRASLSAMALKRPKEMLEADHAAFLQWLKTGLIEEFILAFAAWNVNALEAEKIKAELLVRHRDEGLTVINQA